MEPKEFLDFLGAVEPLKTNTRHCYTAGGTHETVAAHSWRLGVMALLLREEYPDLDMNRVVDMCLIHDFGEAVTGDIPSFDKTKQNEQAEEQALSQLRARLPEPQRNRLAALYREMDAQQTREARLYKALDKLEAVISHNESPLSTWIPLEYQMNLTYGQENAAEFPFLSRLREQMRQDTENKINMAKENLR